MLITPQGRKEYETNNYKKKNQVAENIEGKQEIMVL